MVITYNPYGWKIRPRKTEPQKTLEKERDVVLLKRKIVFLMSEANSRIDQFISYNHDPVMLSIELTEIFHEIKEIIKKIAKLNFELYESREYPSII